MGRVEPSITPALREWIEAQHVFFVATAPSGDGGHVNVSPKGLDCLRVLDGHTVCYLDLTGSGAETIAHLRQNGRITVMFCAFDGPPRIVRLHGRGEVLRPGDDGFDELAGRFPALPGVRSVIRVTAERVSSSCGYAVPLFAYGGERDTLVTWAERRGPDGIEAYWAEKNRVSIDGLPAIDEAVRT
jgi:hypothetical protein